MINIQVKAKNHYQYNIIYLIFKEFYINAFTNEQNIKLIQSQKSINEYIFSKGYKSRSVSQLMNKPLKIDNIDLWACFANININNKEDEKQLLKLTLNIRNHYDNTSRPRNPITYRQQAIIYK